MRSAWLCLHCTDSSKWTGLKIAGHLARICISTFLGNRSKHNLSTNHVQSVQDEAAYSTYQIIDIYRNDILPADKFERYYVNIKSQSKTTKFELDSGSAHTFFPRHKFNSFKSSIQLTLTNIVFRSYTQDTFLPDGKASVHI